MPGHHPPACSELHRQDCVFKTACVNIGAVGCSYNLEGCWLCWWVQLELFALLQETEAFPGKEAKLLQWHQPTPGMGASP